MMTDQKQLKSEKGYITHHLITFRKCVGGHWVTSRFYDFLVFDQSPLTIWINCSVFTFSNIHVNK